MNNLDKIIDLILQDAKNEGHPDKVSCIHAVLMQVNMKIGKEMKKIRDKERRNK
jgi:hypothetical protein